jgi:hypothetical protein
MRNIFKTETGEIVIGQWPNAPLVLWFVFLVAARLPLPELFTRLFDMASFIAIITWAMLEIGWGVNLFRRILGVAVLITALFLRLY